MKNVSYWRYASFLVLILLSQFLILENVKAYEYKPNQMNYYEINNVTNPTIIKSYSYKYTSGSYGSCNNYNFLYDCKDSGCLSPNSNNYQMYEIPGISLTKGHRYKIQVMYQNGEIDFLGATINVWDKGINKNITLSSYMATTQCVEREPVIELEFLQTSDISNGKLYLYANKSTKHISTLDKIYIEDLGVDNDYTCRDSKNNLNINLERGFGSSASIYGVTFTLRSDGGILINGTNNNTTTSDFYIYGLWGSTVVKQHINNASTFSLSSSSTNGNITAYLIYDQQVITYLNNSNSSASIPANSNISAFMIRVNKGQSINNLIVYPQIENGSSVSPFEEYGKQICVNKQDETNDKLDEAEKTRKGILGKIGDLFTAIVELPGKLVNMLIDAIKGLFVPDTEEMNSIIDDFKEVMAEKLGAIYQVADYLTQIFSNITGSNINSNSCMIFPSMTDPIFNIKLWDEQNFCFDTFRTNFKILFTISDSIICIICTCTVINMLHKKLEGFFGGVNSDY